MRFIQETAYTTKLPDTAERTRKQHFNTVVQVLGSTLYLAVFYMDREILYIHGVIPKAVD